MFVSLRWVIRLISLLVFMFSLSQFGTHFREWMMIEPSLMIISGHRAELSAILLERSKQQLEAAKAGIFPSDSDRLQDIKYEVDELSEIAVTIRERIEVLMSLIAFVLSSILVLVAWRPDPIQASKT